MNNFITIIGGGLAGCEAALHLARRGHSVRLYEMRPHVNTPAHESAMFGELVCSNSLKAEGLDTGAGLLKAEMEMMDSLVVRAGKACRVPAGGSLAVNRDAFGEYVTNEIEGCANIEVIREEVTDIPSDRPLIMASGPLTSDTLAEKVKGLFGGGLYFFDAIAPIVDFESVDLNKCFFKSRYGKGDPDFLNCPLTEDEYNAFYDALMEAEKVEFRDFEKMNVFEGCMPVEEMASRGRKTLVFGPMKPVGLEHPETDKRYYAVLQLRKENDEGTAYNLVGFQTKMKIGEQRRVFRMIPGLENAEFLRYGSIHRNTYIHAPGNLDDRFRYEEGFYFAGQMTGVEGYLESAASGIIAAFDLANRLEGKDSLSFPEDTALGSLGRFVTDRYAQKRKKYVPSNFHFGMLPPLPERIKDKKLKKRKAAERAIESLSSFIGG
ncbi:methylenetetrahydrofolate--tRNA-(uracil(54)-C(5))-methyltransferase (FADH(2)-oxidizing) TrmFO [Limisalsivibrio acetivorans]|uniref:methylenetetrahydrofolate--tRNA-(uracil(54)- C(5))-methyltransferase (FADH(2)-oxidizing) TrmFO n=1 Tax=Limisalsivibrio acetivorans TaxID=1304888 RepID=UPI0003B3206F|nr:methylenetetrahydrofolate--tRNA-(uracil(54)-C(5))-methyltransferase (FADH(2)-oxidizing) TrmFO [Limisalsivibrio acetivorans]